MPQKLQRKRLLERVPLAAVEKMLAEKNLVQEVTAAPIKVLSARPAPRQRARRKVSG